MARNSFGVSNWSFSPTFVVRPGVPTGLHVSAVSCSQLDLVWSDNSGSEAGYKVYRNGNLIATLSQDTTSYADSGLSQNTNYSYFVKAYRGNIESNPSNTTNATTTTCSTTPPLLTLSLGSTLKNRPVTIELRYPLLEILGSIFTWSATTDANGNITNFPLTNANPGTAYYVLVKPQGWLRKQEEIILVSGTNLLNLQSRFDSSAAGDINGNNRVDILDYQMLSNTFGGTSSVSDLNGDGSVNILDYQYLSNGFGKVGDGGEILIDGASAGTAAVPSEGQLTLVPSTNAPQVGDVITLDLNFNTATLPMAALEAMIAYDQCVLEPLVNQVTHSGMFATTAIVSTPGTFEYSAHKWTGVNPGSSVSGSGHVASIPFRVIASVPSSTTLAIRFRPGSTYLSNMARDDIVQPFLGHVANAVLYPQGGPQRPSQVAQILSPSSGEILVQDLVLLQAHVSDSCNGTHQVTFFVFHDGQWHPVAVDDDGTDGWAVYWDASQVSDQVIQVKALAGDFAGNGIETAVTSNIILDRRSTADTIFSDIQSNYWALNFIERLYSAGITGGCGANPLNYCPEEMVTRAQMAVFLERGMRGSSYNPPGVGGSTGFGDVQPTHWAGAWIKQLATDGITGGCGSGNYCPESPVTRAQMAVFLLRSKYGPSYSPPAVGGGTGFSDVQPGYWAAAWIKQLVAEGITSGCGTGTYCPESPVTRAQMAVFLVRTFSLP
ncbi:MAG TPA: S-layer homology domain-containing protein [Anaerolineales bacterium]|nr:S-layer homology domain-containing protein [Anaerolineales bacterium]